MKKSLLTLLVVIAPTFAKANVDHLTCKMILKASNVVSLNSFRAVSDTSVESRIQSALENADVVEFYSKMSKKAVEMPYYDLKQYADIDHLESNWESVFQSRFTVAVIKKFVDVIQPEQRRDFLQEVLPATKPFSGDTRLSYLQQRFVLFLLHEWERESAIVQLLVLSVERKHKNNLSNAFHSIGVDGTRESFVYVNQGFLSFLNGDKWFDGSNKGVSVSSRLVLSAAFKRVKAVYPGLASPLDSIELSVIGLAPSAERIESDLSLFFKFIGFSAKKSREFLIDEAKKDPVIAEITYDIMYSSLKFFNSSQALGSDILTWSGLSDVLRAWTPEDVQKAIQKAKLTNPGGIEDHAPSFVLAIRESLYMLSFLLQNDSDITPQVLSDVSFSRLLKNLLISSFSKHNRMLWNRLGVSSNQAIAISFLAVSDVDVRAQIVDYAKELVGARGSTVITDTQAISRIKAELEVLIEQNPVDQEWLESYKEMVFYSSIVFTF